MPIVICRGVRVLKNPTHDGARRLPRLHVAARRDASCATCRGRRRARPASPPRCTARRRGSTCSCSSRSRPAARPARARRSRTTSASRPASRARRSPGARSRRPRSSAPRSRSRARREKLVCDRRPYRIELGNGDSVLARTVVIATGARYRKPALDNLARFEGVGIYYSATAIEARLCGDRRGDRRRRRQLRRTGDGVPRADRAHGLRARAPQPRGDDVALPDPPHRGDAEHQGAASRPRSSRSTAATSSSASPGSTSATGERVTRPIRHVFMMTGASPNTEWLRGCVAIDDKGFVKAGPGSVRARPRRREVAADAPALPVRDQPARRVRGRRRPLDERQARRVGGRRRLDLHPARAQGARGVGSPQVRRRAMVAAPRAGR